jgi:hypothetical protein
VILPRSSPQRIWPTGHPEEESMMRRRKLALAVGGLVLALAAAACSSDNGASGGGTAPAPATGERLSLKGACPDTVVLQTDWVPEAEHGAVYQLLGPGAKIDAGKKRITAPLVASGKDTGVKLEVRAGGPAIGFQQVSAQMYLDQSIHLGYVFTDEAAQNSAKQPTIAVVAPLDINPQMIMWDPKSHPEFNTIGDIGQTDTKVLYFQGATYMEYLVGSGILRRSQIDGSYDGAPATFVSSGGKVAQQGFATSEPYIYEKSLPQWRKPVKFQLINDTGYPVYASAVSIRPADKDKLAPCLKKLVPIIQQAQIDYVHDPTAVNNLLVRLDKEYKTGYPYDEGLAAFTAQQEVRLGIVGNGSDQTLGNFDMNRIKRVIDVVTPIFAAQKKPVKQGLKPDDLVTNEFIDPKIGLR